MAKYFITGKGGLVGSAFAHHPDFRDNTAYGKKSCDITDYKQVLELIEKDKPEILINCAAYTSVPMAQIDPTTALRINAEGSKILADICAKKRIKFIHFSTDFIFGETDHLHKEHDTPAPMNKYGMSKLEGETLIRQVCQDALIIRISWVFGKNGRNFMSAIGDKIISEKELSIVNDQTNRATYVEDLIHAVSILLMKNASGVYHFANKGTISRYDYAVKIAELLSVYYDVARIKPVSFTSFKDDTPRPTHSSMDTEKFENISHWEIPEWDNALSRFAREKYLQEYINSLLD